ncbi:MAG: RdgB/HAM1 family non-canonical purine NTP pyrophosphatase [Candidatus Hydrothermarchaeaceae archaeon]
MIYLLGSTSSERVMLYFQTTNVHKFNEAKEILADYSMSIEHIHHGYEEIQVDDLEEVVVSALSGIPREDLFIEDAGLFIDVLGGFPGVYSSYVLRTLGIHGVLKLMRGADNRNAEFVSMVGLKHMGEVKIFKGVVIGSISPEPRGDSGFGYDPIFVPHGSEKTFAEDIILKREISHRRKALEKLAQYIKKGGFE